MRTNTIFKVVGKTRRDGELTVTEGMQRIVPSRRFPVAVPRYERRRMQVALARAMRIDRKYCSSPGRDMDEFRKAEADRERLNKVERLHLNIDYEGNSEYQDIRAQGDPWVVYEDASLSEVLGHAGDVRAAIDSVSEFQANPARAGKDGQE